jgi:hypothetical protein
MFHATTFSVSKVLPFSWTFKFQCWGGLLFWDSLDEWNPVLLAVQCTRSAPVVSRHLSRCVCVEVLSRLSDRDYEPCDVKTIEPGVGAEVCRLVLQKCHVGSRG